MLIANSSSEASYFAARPLDTAENLASDPIQFERRSPDQLGNSVIQQSYTYLKQQFYRLDTLQSSQFLYFSAYPDRYFLTIAPYHEQPGLDCSWLRWYQSLIL